MLPQFLPPETPPLLEIHYEIFFIWTYGKKLFIKFYQNLNNFHLTISFSSSAFEEQVNFLDVLVTIQNGYINITLYMKPTETYACLNISSFYPQHTIKSIIYS